MSQKKETPTAPAATPPVAPDVETKAPEEVETPTPPVAPEVEETAEETSEETVKVGFKKVRVADFRGSFAGTSFNDNCEAEISDTDLELLTKQFPGAEVVEL